MAVKTAKRDYYEVLGVRRDAEEKELKRAYRRLAKQYHPDMNAGDAEAGQKFKEVTEAYEILSNPEKRKQYDRFGFAAFDGSMGMKEENPFDEGKSSFSDFSGDDFFETLFGSGFYTGFHGKRGEPFNEQFSRKNRSSVCPEAGGRDVEAELTISFEEAAFGCKKTIRLSGSYHQQLEVSIPAGIDEGQSVRLKGKGQSGGGLSGTQNGDLLLKIHIAAKAGYERKGLDVYTMEKIPYPTAVLGGEAVFHTLYGEVKCRIPAGIQSGSRIRLRRKGIVSMKNPTVYGDAYVEIQIAVPRRVSPQEEKLLRGLQESAG